MSLDHGPLARFLPYSVCRFRPTCSEYGFIAFGRYGFWKGGWMTARRIGRCHPWQQGGMDPVPEKKN
ncbi:MAG: membrane protein insertion efficiency factor YidD [bacterium]|nr:membrane protein insertion efficiency factor YidD [bacterium]